ncbi:MmcQ/YjbR family DNA-binding protein [Micromonospora sp. BRA006-A]|nr:MmcQ/YjbR family DNA-binding protein [Micromonospora sp. BRA006-A]
MTGPGDVPPEHLDRLRPICLGLPETYEEAAWVGVRWRIRGRTFAHVLTVDPGHQAAYARAAATDEPVCVMTFRSPATRSPGCSRPGRTSCRTGPPTWWACGWTRTRTDRGRRAAHRELLRAGPEEAGRARRRPPGR